MGKGRLGIAIIGLSALLSTATIFADATITLRGIDDAKQTLIQVRNGVVRMGEQGDPEYSLYDQTRDVLIAVDGRHGTYMEFDQAMLQKMSAQMAGMQGMIAEQMQNMPPEQRAMMEAQMGGMMGLPPADAAPGKKLQAESRGGKTVGGVSCQSYALFDGARKVADVCMAKAGDIAISAEDYATLMAMMDFTRDMTQATSMMGEPADPLMMSDVQGVPLEMKGSADGDNFTLGSVSQGRLDAGLFEAYKALRKQDPMQDAMRGGMPDGMSDHMMDSHP
ncbi:hypothetical protein MNBD_GAMMA20-2227 [hydrothermal vent metagenome]|uniref:DUF4412 domain-containing protein n=1 Tax=hydrothermal vent metagenome TaxID=652676 RepID=A0A3B1B7A2_9ZZZZ